MRTWIGLALGVGIAALAPACSSSCPSLFTTASSTASSSSSSGAPVCPAGIQVSCACAGPIGQQGAQRCADDGSGYGPCLGCGGTGGAWGATSSSSASTGGAGTGGVGGQGAADADAGDGGPTCVATCAAAISMGGEVCAGDGGDAGPGSLLAALQTCSDMSCATQCSGLFPPPMGGIGQVCNGCLATNCPNDLAACQSN